MAYTTINKSTAHFNTKLYTGNGSSNAITGVGFQPDLIWWKCRNSSKNHGWTDAVRGNTKRIQSNSTAAETTVTDYIQSFDSDGTTIGSNGNINSNGDTFCLWNWKANGQGSANTDGTLNTTYTSANTTSGISIMTYTGNGVNSNGATIGHGLGVRPRVCIIKNLNLDNQHWEYFQDTKNNGKGGGATGIRLQLNTTQSNFGNSEMNFTNTTISLPSNDDAYNSSGKTYVCYAFTPIAGYSKFGSYKGNGNADGTFVYTGFKPAFILMKSYTAAETWVMYDNKRLGYNDYNNFLSPDSSNGASTGHGGNGAIDIVSNGFKMRGTGSAINNGSRSYIYMAFAEAPLVGTNNVPCTAR